MCILCSMRKTQCAMICMGFSCQRGTLRDTVTFCGSIRSLLRHQKLILMILHCCTLIWQFGNHTSWSGLSLQCFNYLKSIFLSLSPCALIWIGESAYMALRSTNLSNKLQYFWWNFNTSTMHAVTAVPQCEQCSIISKGQSQVEHHSFRISLSQAAVVLWNSVDSLVAGYC